MAHMGRFKHSLGDRTLTDQEHPFKLTLWNSLMSQQCATRYSIELLTRTNVDSERTKSRNALIQHKDPCIAKILPPPPNPRRRRRKILNSNGDASLLMSPLPRGLPKPLIPYVDGEILSSSSVIKELNIELPSASKQRKDELSLEDRTRDLLSEYKPGSRQLDPPLQPKILLSSVINPQYEESIPPATKLSSKMSRGGATAANSSSIIDTPVLFSDNNVPLWGRAIPKDQLMLPHKRIASADASSSKPRSLSALRTSWSLVRRPVSAYTGTTPLGMSTVTRPISTDFSFTRTNPSTTQLNETEGLRRLPVSRETSKSFSSKSSRSTTNDSKAASTKKSTEGSIKKRVRRTKGSDILTFKKMCDFVNNLLLVEARIEKKTNWRYRYFCDWIEMGREYRLAVERLRLLKAMYKNKMVDDVLKQTSLYSFYSSAR